MKKHLTGLFAVMTAVALTGCVDDNYDLSDIDSTVRVGVDDLSLGVKLDQITLKSVIDTDGSDITVIDGVFAVQKEGDFHSSEISIDPILLDKPNLLPARTTIDTSGLEDAVATQGAGQINLHCSPVDFSYVEDNISTDIVSIDAVGSNFTIGITLAFEGLDASVKSMTYKNLVFQLPKGLTYDQAKSDGTYDKTTGLFNVSERNVQGTSLTVYFYATNVDKSSGFTFVNQTMTFQDKMWIESGVAEVKAADLKEGSTVPASSTFVTTFDMSEIDVLSFTGRLQYAIEDFTVPSVDLSSLPKALSDPQTNIVLKNPQIYLDMNNPVGVYGAKATTGMAITPYRGDVASPACEIAADAIELYPTKSIDEVINFCLSPMKPESYMPGYEKSTYVPYSSLGQILSGNGLPTRLAITLINPGLPEQPVTDFPVGRALGKVNGNYVFYAPLQLDMQSRIIYTETVDGWWSEDLNDLTITDLHVTANVTTDAPLAVDFTGYPIDKNNKQIGNVTIEGATVPGNARNVPIDIHITGEIKGLNGIEFTAFVTPESETAVKENQSIQLRNIHATVSGYYTRKL